VAPLSYTTLDFKVYDCACYYFLFVYIRNSTNNAIRILCAGIVDISDDVTFAVNLFMMFI